jgi:predicted kinase
MDCVYTYKNQTFTDIEDLKSFIGNETKPAQNELYKILLNAEEQLMEKLPELLRRTGHRTIEELIIDYGFNPNTDEGKFKILSELAARWAETLVDKPKPSWWRQILQAISNWISKFTGHTLNEDEVNELVGGFVRYGTDNTQSQQSLNNLTVEEIEDNRTKELERVNDENFGFSNNFVDETIKGDTIFKKINNAVKELKNYKDLPVTIKYGGLKDSNAYNHELKYFKRSSEKTPHIFDINRILDFRFSENFSEIPLGTAYLFGLPNIFERKTQPVNTLFDLSLLDGYFTTSVILKFIYDNGINQIKLNKDELYNFNFRKELTNLIEDYKEKNNIKGKLNEYQRFDISETAIKNVDDNIDNSFKDLYDGLINNLAAFYKIENKDDIDYYNIINFGEDGMYFNVKELIDFYNIEIYGRNKTIIDEEILKKDIRDPEIDEINAKYDKMLEDLNNSNEEILDNDESNYQLKEEVLNKIDEINTKYDKILEDLNNKEPVNIKLTSSGLSEDGWYDYREYTIFKDGKEIGFISLPIELMANGDLTTKKTVNSVELIGIDKEERGKKYGVSAYKQLIMLLNKEGLQLETNEEFLTKGSKGIWDDLVKEGYATKKEEDYFSNKIIQQSTKQEILNKDKLDEINTKYNKLLEDIKENPLTEVIDTNDELQELEVEQDISELFESNPELVDKIYEDLGFVKPLKALESNFEKVQERLNDVYNVFALNLGNSGLPFDYFKEVELNIDDLDLSLKNKGMFDILHQTNKTSDYLKSELTSIDKQKNPILINNKGQVLEGWHRIHSLKANGVKTIKAYVPITSQQKQQVQQLYDEYLELLDKPNVNPTLQGNQKPDVIIPIGTSGSGKSTWIKSINTNNQFVVISPDEMRVEFTGDMNNKTKDDEIYQAVIERAINAVKEGKQVIIDTTNLKKERRRPFIEAVKEFLPDSNIQYKLLPLDVELAKLRIKADIELGVNRANVSDATIDRHAESYKEMLEDIKSEDISNYDYQQEQLKKFVKLQELKNKPEFQEGIKFAFSNNEELQNTIYESLDIKMADISFNTTPFGKSMDNIDIIKNNKRIGFIQVDKDSNSNILTINNIGLRQKDLGEYVYLKLQNQYPNFIIESDLESSSEKDINVWDSLVEKGLAIEIPNGNYTLTNQSALDKYADYIAQVSLGIIKNPSTDEFNDSDINNIVYQGDVDLKKSSKFKVSKPNDNVFFITPSPIKSDKNNNTEVIVNIKNNELGILKEGNIIEKRNDTLNYKSVKDLEKNLSMYSSQWEKFNWKVTRISDTQLFIEKPDKVIKKVGIWKDDELVLDLSYNKGNIKDIDVETVQKLQEMGIKGVIIENLKSINNTKWYALFNPEQTHILSSTQDIEGVKEFVQEVIPEQDVIETPIDTQPIQEKVENTPLTEGEAYILNLLEEVGLHSDFFRERIAGSIENFEVFYNEYLENIPGDTIDEKFNYVQKLYNKSDSLEIEKASLADEISSYGESFPEVLDGVMKKLEEITNALNKEITNFSNKEQKRDTENKELKSQPSYQEMKRLEKVIDELNNYASTYDFDANTKDLELEQSTEIRQGIPELFTENPKLASIGTQEQYEEHLNTIFPESQVRKIVYHIGNVITVTDDKPFYTTEQGNWLEELQGMKEGKLQAMLINVVNPTILDEDIELTDKAVMIRNIDANDNVLTPFEALEEGTDSIIGRDYGQFYDEKTYVTFKSNQVHVLGTEQDMNRFKEFVNSTEQSIDNQVIQEVQEPVDIELLHRIQKVLQDLYPEIKLEFSNNPVWQKGDDIFNQLIQDDYFEGNPKYFTEIERISNLILNKLKFKLKEFNGNYDASITSLEDYKRKVLDDLLNEIGITGSILNLEELKNRLSSPELQTSLNSSLFILQKNAQDYQTQLETAYYTKRLLNNFLTIKDINQYDSEQQEIIKKYLPSLFKANKFKSYEQAIAFNKNRINSTDWLEKTFKLDKIPTLYLGAIAKIKKTETLINYFKIDPVDAAERIYLVVENELNRRERFFLSEKVQGKVNAKLVEEKLKEAEEEKARQKTLDKYKDSTVVEEVENIIGQRNIHNLEKVLESENINVELAIIKNNGYPLDKTPQGVDSKLFQSILALPEVNGNIEIAKKIKSLTYSDNFMNWFGDWINNSEESSQIVDDNGEPKLVYHGSGREYEQFEEKERGSATGKWKDRLSDSEMSFMFTDNPSVAFFYAVIERQQVLGEIKYYLRETAFGPTQELVNDMYKKYPAIKNWVNSLKEKGLSTQDILEEFKRVTKEYNIIDDLTDQRTLGNPNNYLNNLRLVISHLENNKEKILKEGFYKDINKWATATINPDDDTNPIWLSTSKEFRSSSILADGRLVGFDEESLNGKNIKELTSDEYDIIVAQFKEDSLYLYQRMVDKLKAGGFKPKIYPVFLNAKKVNKKDFEKRPFVLQQGDTQELLDKRETQGAMYEVADLVEEALNSGLEGSIIENIADPNISTNYAIFKPNQIKSLFNIGEYNSSNNNFYNQVLNGKIIGQANIKAGTVLIAASFKATDLQINNMIKEGLIKKECK